MTLLIVYIVVFFCMNLAQYQLITISKNDRFEFYAKRHQDKNKPKKSCFCCCCLLALSGTFGLIKHTMSVMKPSNRLLIHARCVIEIYRRSQSTCMWNEKLLSALKHRFYIHFDDIYFFVFILLLIKIRAHLLHSIEYEHSKIEANFPKNLNWKQKRF